MPTFKEVCGHIVEPGIPRKALGGGTGVGGGIIMNGITGKALDTTRDITQEAAVATKEFRELSAKTIQSILDFLSPGVETTDILADNYPKTTEKIIKLIEYNTGKEYDLLTQDDLSYVESLLYDIMQAGSNAEAKIMDPTTWENLKLIFDISNVSMGLSIAYLLAMFGYYDTKKERITTFKMASSVIIMCYLVKMGLTDQYQEILDYLGFGNR